MGGMNQGDDPLHGTLECKPEWQWEKKEEADSILRILKWLVLYIGKCELSIQNIGQRPAWPDTHFGKVNQTLKRKLLGLYANSSIVGQEKQVENTGRESTVEVNKKEWVSEITDML